jgi:penicillin-binding protein 1A
MGRDDARAVAGLQGGRAPARAFADFMRYAVSSRPVEQFDTEVTLPEWQLEDEDDAYFGDPLEDEIFVDENGMPIANPGPYGGDRRYDDVVAPDNMSEEWLDEVLRRSEGERRSERRNEPPPRNDRNAPSAPAIRPQENDPTQ